jgi:hypothetical protein
LPDVGNQKRQPEPFQDNNADIEPSFGADRRAGRGTDSASERPNGSAGASSKSSCGREDPQEQKQPGKKPSDDFVEFLPCGFFQGFGDVARRGGDGVVNRFAASFESQTGEVGKP